MLITARQVEDAVASGQTSVQVPGGSIVTPAARDRARELGIPIGAALTNGASHNGNGNAGRWVQPGSGATAPAPASGAAPQPERPAYPPPANQRATGSGRVAQHEMDIKPNYFESPAIDNLFTIALELGAALWVVKDRLRVIEEFLDKQGMVTSEQVEMYQPTPEKKKELLEQRNAFIERIYGIIKDNPG